MASARDIILALMPRGWRASAEAATRAWQVTCPSCGAADSLWNLGGLRWKASGSKSWLRRCGACGKTGWHTITRPATPGSWRAAAEAETREWRVTCPKCGASDTLLNLGGLRWKAAGSSRSLRRCTSCGKLGWHRVARP